MSEPFLGEIRMVGFNFAPRGWTFCDGQLLPIADNSALFSLLGTTYGGDGRNTLGLPDLRGRVPIHVGTGGGLPQVRGGERGGSASESLTVNQIPSHSHALRAVDDDPNLGSPGGNLLANSNIYTNSAGDTSMSSGAIQNQGGGQSHNNMQPFLGLYFVIALVGLFPSRN